MLVNNHNNTEPNYRERKILSPKAELGTEISERIFQSLGDSETCLSYKFIC